MTERKIINPFEIGKPMEGTAIGEIVKVNQIILKKEILY